MNSTRRRALLRCIGGWIGTTIAISAAFAQSPGDYERKIRFDIPSQALSTALIAYAEQARVQLIVPAEAIEGLTAIAINGEFDARSALTALLAQSDLAFEITGPRTITVSRKAAR